MKTSLFLIIVLLSGAFAGLVHGSANLVLVEPYLDEAIGIENQNLFASGDEDDTLEFWVEYEGYRTWQKGGQILAGVILGTSIGALFGIVFALSRNSLPGNGNIKKALILAGIMWLTIYFIPFLKYPAKSSNCRRCGYSCFKSNSISFIYCNFWFCSCRVLQIIKNIQGQQETCGTGWLCCFYFRSFCCNA